jgi:hypothetical protein
MGVSRPPQRREITGRKPARTIHKSCSEAGTFFHASPAAKLAKGRARIGPKSVPQRTVTSADSLSQGDQNVRTLYGEGTARDLLCAV